MIFIGTMPSSTCLRISNFPALKPFQMILMWRNPLSVSFEAELDPARLNSRIAWGSPRRVFRILSCQAETVLELLGRSAGPGSMVYSSGCE